MPVPHVLQLAKHQQGSVLHVVMTVMKDMNYMSFTLRGNYCLANFNCMVVIKTDLYDNFTWKVNLPQMHIFSILWQLTLLVLNSWNYTKHLNIWVSLFGSGKFMPFWAQHYKETKALNYKNHNLNTLLWKVCYLVGTAQVLLPVTL